MHAPDADFLRRLEAVSTTTEATLKSLLGEAPLAGEVARPARLLAAVRYATEGGKRLRPFLVIESAALFGIGERQSLPAAAALIPHQTDRKQTRLRSDEGEGDVQSTRSPVDRKEHRSVGLSGRPDLHLPTIIAVDAEFLVTRRQVQVGEDFSGNVFEAQIGC